MSLSVPYENFHQLCINPDIPSWCSQCLVFCQETWIRYWAQKIVCIFSDRHISMVHMHTFSYQVEAPILGSSKNQGWRFLCYAQIFSYEASWCASHFWA